jgi:photosystem II stability/assembly factor-like uncharacterized protein
VSAVDANICWASGSKGTVLRTIDGGAHWTKLPVPNADKLDFRDVEAFDANTAIIMSAGLSEQGAAKIFKTTDGGAHWKEHVTLHGKGYFLDSMAFWDHRRGIVLSDPVGDHFMLFTTDDAGETWKELNPVTMPDSLPNEGAFAASGTAIAVAGKDDVWFGTGGSGVARVFHSSDHGEHWSVAEVPIAAGTASAGVFGLAFKDQKHGVAVGGDYKQKDRVTFSVAETSDGGNTWKGMRPLPDLQGVAFAGTDLYVAIGNGSFVSSTNKWEIDKDVTGNAIAVGRDNRHMRWFVVGSKGTIFVHPLRLDD